MLQSGGTSISIRGDRIWSWDNDVISYMIFVAPLWCEGLVSVLYHHFPAEVVLKGRLNPLGPKGWRYSKDGQALVRIASASSLVLQRPLAGTGSCLLEVTTTLLELLP